MPAPHVPSPYLTKSRYNLASECPRKLWYQARRDEYPNAKREDEFMQALADGGHQIGAMAQCLHPGGVLIDSRDIPAAINKTAELLKRDNVIIYEAALQSGSYLVLVDVLIKTKSGVELIEVKAKSWDPANSSFFKVKGGLYPKWTPYLQDVAFQTWVARQVLTGQTITPYLLLVDKSKLVEDDGLNQLFRVESDANQRRIVRVLDPKRVAVVCQGLLVKVPAAVAVDQLLAGMAKIPAEEIGGLGQTLPDRAGRFAQILASNQPFPAPIVKAGPKTSHAPE